MVRSLSMCDMNFLTASSPNNRRIATPYGEGAIPYIHRLDR